MASSHESVSRSAKEFVELFTRLSENLTKASDKNDALLEALETAEARALVSTTGGSSSTSEVTLLRNMRARLAASHAPNSALRRDLPTFTGLFEKRFKELDVTVRSYQELNSKLLKESKELDDGLNKLEEQKRQFENERERWRQDLDQARNEIVEQNDRLTVLSQQLAGTKLELDARSNQLASQRIAFEEEKMVRENIDTMAVGSEADSLRKKLRTQALKNVELENTLLKTELVLHQAEEHGTAVETRNSRLAAEVQQLRVTSSRAIKQFEKRTSDANKKLAEMNGELAKAQEHAKRFQDLLAAERRKQKTLQHALEQEMQHKTATGGEVLAPTAQKAYIDALSETLGTTDKPKNLKRVEDVLRKSEATLVENAHLKAEIRKLRIDNADLLRRVRFADTNAHYMRNQVFTNLYDRAELIKKLDKTEHQHRDLQQSLTKQASDWVSQRRKDKDTEKTTQWSQIEPVPVLGASERTWNVPSRPQPTGRSIAVQKW